MRALAGLLERMAARQAGAGWLGWLAGWLARKLTVIAGNMRPRPNLLERMAARQAGAGWLGWLAGWLAGLAG